MKRKAGKGGVAGIDPEGTNKDATQVEAPRVGEGSNDPEVVAKAEEDEDEESAEFEAGEEEEKMEESKKSLTGSDLEASLDRLEEFAKSGDLPSRKETLLAQAGEGELNKSEREELFNLLGGIITPEQTASDEPGESIVKSMSENENLQKALDVSDYLQEQHTELVKSLRRVGDEIQKSDNRRHEFNLILAKAVKDIGEMTKSLSEAVATMAGQPARAPKSIGITTKPGQIMQKSFTGQPTAGETLSKSQVLDALDAMMEESMSKGMSGATDFGEDISMAVAKYEQTHMISPSMLKAVQSKISQQRMTA